MQVGASWPSCLAKLLKCKNCCSTHASSGIDCRAAPISRAQTMPRAAPPALAQADASTFQAAGLNTALPLAPANPLHALFT